MSNIIFYTKPGCKGGQRQKELLLSSGHTVEERSIFDKTWTPESLKPYLVKLKIEDWYNKNAPDVKAGTVIPGALSMEDTLKLLCSNPILIKRPLMEINNQLIAGFDVEFLKEIIELKNIPNEDLTKCKMGSSNKTCDSLMEK